MAAGRDSSHGGDFSEYWEEQYLPDDRGSGRVRRVNAAAGTRRRRLILFLSLVFPAVSLFVLKNVPVSRAYDIFDGKGALLTEVSVMKELNSGTGVLLSWEDGGSPVYSDWPTSESITAARTADMTGVRVDEPMVALTFDDGPDHEDYTERILAALREYGGHATFFQCGRTSAELPDKIALIVREGHEIGCHTYNHDHYGDEVTPDDIVKADDAIEKACGQRPSVFRSPGGMTTDLIRGVCVDEHMPIFYWSIDTEDWKSRNADSVCKAVMDHVKDGDIILMHNVYSSTAEAVERIVPFLAEKGYQMVTVSQLVEAKTGKPPVPGTQYITATITN